MSTVKSTFPDRLILAWAILSAAVLFVLFRDTGFDDPFITYRYAVNLANGNGFVYNPGERVLSTTAPLYALLLVPFAMVGADLPLVSNLIGTMSLGAGSVALWRMGRMGGMPVAGAAAALLFPLTPLLINTLGAETMLFLALVFWGFEAAWHERPWLAGVLLAAATLTRADAGLAVVMAGLLLLKRNGLRPALTFGAVVALTALPFVAAAWWYFGSPLPVTLGAKQSQADIPGGRSYLAGLVLRLGNLWNWIPWRPFAVLIVIGCVQALWKRGPLALVAGWSLAHALAYSLLGVTDYFWYFGPVMTGLTILGALGIQLLADLGERVGGRRAGLSVATGLIVLALAGYGSIVTFAARNPDLRIPAYREAGEWLAANTEPDARVGTLEIGVIGYYSQRPMIDFAGLIQPEVNAIFREGGGYRDAALAALGHHRPAYVVNHEEAFPLITHDPTLAAACEEVAALPDPRFATPLQIYHCTW
ncbi:hypothetical protein [Candidatus Chloroploca asiatica]|uniref:Glycosyltransferase RgtA/B/C/D-like domain-containing protein n=1 Tax=Candidatus Chloroploca asiatica TaxID=1506545 RepID=A0A2H3L4P6_9CHLR|nr:hypothetical protein [Candidatus Chloroploca asiatica]PDV99814.1 hypothetical protein A9Q02_00965 [Candidatus Chloroploca asiatica]